MCGECQRLLEEYGAINEQLRAVIRDLADIARSREVDMFNKLWQRGLAFSQQSQSIRRLLLKHLRESHGG
jgi:hypothetical protein